MIDIKEEMRDKIVKDMFKIKDNMNEFVSDENANIMIDEIERSIYSVLKPEILEKINIDLSVYIDYDIMEIKFLNYENKELSLEAVIDKYWNFLNGSDSFKLTIKI